MKGLSEAELPARLKAIEEFADVGSFFDQPMRTYSSGMYMRVAFASAITVDPDILIVDEALAVGDARFQNKCFNRFFEMQKAGKTIILVTHSADLVARVCTRGVLLDAGAISFDGAPTDAVNHYMAALYGEGVDKRDVAPPTEQADAKTEQESIDKEVIAEIAHAPIRIFDEHDKSDRLSKRWFYNKNERRYGNGQARILDADLFVDDDPHAGIVDFKTRLSIVFKVLALENLKDVSFGVVVKTTDNVRVYGASSKMREVPLYSLEKSICHEFRIDVDTPLCSGDYFLDLTCALFVDGDYVVCDARQSSVHFYVTSSGQFNGLVDLNATFSQRL
jgi:lipopolysaccharide transport system ATP-binding protein